jgi:tRNA (cmo5U34)-methyltransferase
VDTTTSTGTRVPVMAGADAVQPVDFDTRPPVPVAEYEHIVKSVNVGYELFFTLSHSVLRSLGRSDLDLLVVGAGGGAEIETFLPPNPGWRITGVDPSQDMLGLAHARAERLRVVDRVDLIHGTVEDVPAEDVFDAATCLFVLHFLSDDDKLALLRGIGRRLRSGSPVLIASGTRVLVTDETVRADLLGAWQQYGEIAGMPAERMASTIQQVTTQQAMGTAESDYVRLFHAAGFTHVAQALSVLGGGLVAWIVR